MAYVMNYYDWDRSGAEQEFKRALELNPNDAATYHAYGRFLASMGRVDEARAELNRAQELDPYHWAFNPMWESFPTSRGSTRMPFNNSKKFLCSIPNSQCRIGESACVANN
jgi:tetratricopeptide (TPR) repeat protein